MFQKNCQNILENFYDKYAAVMYGVIKSLVPNKKIADGILINAFIEIKENSLFLNLTEQHYINILKFTYNFTVKQLMLFGILQNKCEYFLRHNIIHLLCTTCSSIKEVARLLEVSEAETVIQLQLEMLTFRNNKKIKKVVYE